MGFNSGFKVLMLLVLSDCVNTSFSPALIVIKIKEEVVPLEAYFIKEKSPYRLSKYWTTI